MPLVAVAATLYYAHAYPTVDGDTVKALFLLPRYPRLRSASDSPWRRWVAAPDRWPSSSVRRSRCAW